MKKKIHYWLYLLFPLILMQPFGIGKPIDSSGWLGIGEIMLWGMFIYHFIIKRKSLKSPIIPGVLLLFWCVLLLSWLGVSSNYFSSLYAWFHIITGLGIAWFVFYQTPIFAYKKLKYTFALIRILLWINILFQLRGFSLLGMQHNQTVTWLVITFPWMFLFSKKKLLWLFLLEAICVGIFYQNGALLLCWIATAIFMGVRLTGAKKLLSPAIIAIAIGLSLIPKNLPSAWSLLDKKSDVSRNKLLDEIDPIFYSPYYFAFGSGIGTFSDSYINLQQYEGCAEDSIITLKSKDTNQIILFIIETGSISAILFLLVLWHCLRLIPNHKKIDENLAVKAMLLLLIALSFIVPLSYGRTIIWVGITIGLASSHKKCEDRKKFKWRLLFLPIFIVLLTEVVWQTSKMEKKSNYNLSNANAAVNGLLHKLLYPENILEVMAFPEDAVAKQKIVKVEAEDFYQTAGDVVLMRSQNNSLNRYVFFEKVKSATNNSKVSYKVKIPYSNHYRFSGLIFWKNNTKLSFKIKINEQSLTIKSDLKGVWHEVNSGRGLDLQKGVYTLEIYDIKDVIDNNDSSTGELKLDNWQLVPR